MSQGRLGILLVGLLVILSACGTATPAQPKFWILQAVAYLGFDSEEQVRFPLVAARLPEGTYPSIEACTLMGQGGTAVTCQLDPAPQNPGLAAWYVEISKLIPGVYTFESVSLTSAGRDHVFGIGQYVVEVTIEPSPSPIRVGSYVTQASTVQAYTVEVINTIEQPITVEGLQLRLEQISPGRTLVSQAIDAQPKDFSPDDAGVTIPVGERRNLRFQFDRSPSLGLGLPCVLLKPFARYSAESHRGLHPLPLASYIPAVPVEQLYGHLRSLASETR